MQSFFNLLPYNYKSYSC